MALSRTELMLQQLIAEFQTISTQNGYRTDPVQVIGSCRHPDDIKSFPEFGIELGDEEVITKDDNWDMFDSVVQVTIQGAVKCDVDTGDDLTNLQLTSESVVHDFKRKIAELMKKFILQNASGTAMAWNITPSKTMQFTRMVGFGTKRNIGVVFTQFSVRIRNQDATFTT